jgi:hypothetical protein
MKLNLSFSLIILLSFVFFQYSEARIVNRRVKEAPKACRIMNEDGFLSREDKKVLGTLRHSLLIDNDDKNIILVKDKGEKICEWSFDQWAGIQTENKLPDISNFKFHIDEYKNVIYPFVQKQDNSYFVINIPISTCDLNNQVTKVNLELPKCEIPKKYASRRSSKKKSRRIASRK